MKEMTWYLLGVITQSPQCVSPAQHPIFNYAIECTWASLGVYMYARYTSHDDATLSYMGDSLCCFHTLKDVFLLGRASKKANAKSYVLRTELMTKQNVDRETNSVTGTLSKKRCKMNARWGYISHKIDVSKELDADFNCLKIHLMSDWVKQICRYGAFQQYSAQRHGQAPEMNLKDGWNASNDNLNFLPLVITYLRRMLGFEIREHNLQALSTRWENSATACNVLPSGTALAAPLCSHSSEKPKFMGPQNPHDGKHTDPMIKDFRALLENTQDITPHVAIYTGTWEFIKHKSHNKTYISDEQLHAMELCIQHGIKIQVEGLEGEHISEICQCI